MKRSYEAIDARCRGAYFAMAVWRGSVRHLTSSESSREPDRPAAGGWALASLGRLAQVARVLPSISSEVAS